MKIHDCARRGDIAGIAAELAAGVDINSVEKFTDSSALEIICAMPDASVETIQWLINSGAKITPQVFQATASSGTMASIDFLLRSGAEVDSMGPKHGGSIEAAVRCRCWSNDPLLTSVIEILLANGADIDATSSYGESAIRAAACRGPFRVVQFLIDKGATTDVLQWNELARAIALGTLEDVRAALKQSPNLSERDGLERTAFLLSIQVGDIEKAKLLISAGAEPNDVGYLGQPPITYAVHVNQFKMIPWLVSLGCDVNQACSDGDTPLIEAADLNSQECIEALLKLGADPSISTKYGSSAIRDAVSWSVASQLIEAGEDLTYISDEVRREILGLTGGDLECTVGDYRANRHPRFGRANPERMDNGFWAAMIHCGYSAYGAQVAFNDSDNGKRPGWSYDRFGRSITRLRNGRVIEIAGEHEDSYDSDFCIYNDVVVFDGKGGFEIYGYPESVFPPTDFHSATLVDDYIYVIGCLGYGKQRTDGETPVYRLNWRNLQIERVPTSGDKPGWISSHRARYDEAKHQIHITGGEIYFPDHLKNETAYALDLTTLKWSRTERPKD